MAEIVVDTGQNNPIEPRVVHDAVELLSDLLHNFKGTFKARVLNHIRMRGDARLRLGTPTVGRLMVKVKPGDNSTAWEWGIEPPPPLTAASLYRMLKEQNVPNGDDEAEKPAKPTKPTKPAATPAPAPAPAASASVSTVTLADRIAELQSISTAYDEREKRIHAIGVEIEQKMQELEKVQQQHEEDFTGKQAHALLAELRRVVGI